MFKRHFQPRLIVAFGALFGGAVVLGSGCSSSDGASSGASNDGSAGAGDAAPVHRGDASSIMSTADTGSSTGAGLYDGTVGETCKTNADCQPAGGAGINICSATLTSGVLFPTPVCVLPACDPGTDGNLHFCDGPDMPTSPGVCFNLGGGSGYCLPQCQLLTTGAPPIGCAAGSACAELALGVDSKGDVAGAFGACLSACVQDADCPAGTVCQVDTGSCVTKIVPPTKAAGAPCTDGDTACSCFTGVLADGGVGDGVCAPSCVTGPTSSCPAGFVCDALLETTVMTADASVAGFSIENPGLIGRCFQSCSAGAPTGDASLPGASADGAAPGGDASSTAAGTCPAVTTCETFETAGPDCLP